ncbi:MAG: sodium:solute symporter [Gammaproteobacteria bacterium]|nr:sodium:solute symporter [Gammaproteobacteria bacterium]
MLLQLVICFIVVRGLQNEQDYLLAGRKLRLPMITMTIFATWFGAESCIGAAGAIYDNGLSGGRADPFGYALCILFMGVFFARKLWSRKLMTLADFYRQRYGKVAEKFGVVLMVPPSVIWAAAQILAFGHVLAAVSTMPIKISIGFAAIVVITYTALGGMLADVISDFIQGTVLIIGLAILFVIVFMNLPDPDVLRPAFIPERLSFRQEDESWLAVINGWSIPFIGSLFAAELINRVLASNSPDTAHNGALLAGGLYLLVGFMPLTLGMIGPTLLPGLEDGEQILPLLAEQYLSPVLYVIFIGALVSAILSTVDSALLNAGALLSHNLIIPLLKQPSETSKVLCARASVVSFGIIAYVLAINADGVYNLVVEASAFGSAGIFTCCVMGLTQKRGGPYTAVSSMAIGMVSYGLLAYVIDYDYAYLMSLICTFSTYCILMFFEEPFEEFIPAQI